MSNDVKVTVTGNAGSDPVIRRSGSGTEWTTFSVASTRRIRDTNGEFYDGPTIWFQVKAWGHPAVNISKSVKKGQPVMVAGRLEVDEWGDPARPRTSLVISADSVGPNLMKGRAEFQRVIPSDEPPGARESSFGQAGQSGPGHGTPVPDPWGRLGEFPEGSGAPEDAGDQMAEAAVSGSEPSGADASGAGRDDGETA